MSATRVQIPVPAAGVSELVAVAGRIVFVELSPSNTIAGVPTFHVIKGDEGAPLYSKSALAWMDGFRRFWVKGTAAAAGETLYLLVYDDPCAEGVFGPNAPISASPCGESGPTTAPEGEPNAFLISDQGGLLRIVDTSGTLIRDLNAGGTLDRIARADVDYSAGWIYYAGVHDVTGDRELRRVNFDGSNDILLSTIGPSLGSTAEIDVALDRPTGRVIVYYANNIATCPVGGGTTTTRGQASGSRSICSARDGLHFIRATDTELSVKLINSPSGSSVHFIGGVGGRSCAVDEIRRRVFYGTGSSSGNVAAAEPDLTFIENVIGYSNTVAGRLALYKLNRWLYVKSEDLIRRVHLDDYSIVEQLGTVSGHATAMSFAPFWE